MKMVNVTAIIERASDGGFATYMLESFEKFAAHGFGNTAEEAKEDLFVAIEEFREMLGDDVPQMNITFKYDITSFLAEYRDKFGLSGLQIITGLNRKRLQEYLSGERHPSPKTVRKIEQSVHDFASKLMDLQLAYIRL
ncbi:MAG: helix-turn-helix transcriptional regulator [Bacteroidales bacterium]|jgi:predicted RNase H-like HicB family nuclease|nr:helix-turn-helix transcriptional regulator [Bacteroidales bacterium]